MPRAGTSGVWGGGGWGQYGVGSSRGVGGSRGMAIPIPIATVHRGVSREKPRIVHHRFHIPPEILSPSPKRFTNKIYASLSWVPISHIINVAILLPPDCIHPTQVPPIKGINLTTKKKKVHSNYFFFSRIWHA